MAYTATVKGQHIIVQMGDGATPTEVFTTICGITEKGLEQTASTSEETIWDCADQDAPPKVVRDVQSTDWSISASGQVDSSGLAALDTAFTAAVERNFRFVFKDTVINKYKQGPGIITSFSVTGTNGEKAKVSLTITGAGALTTLTANP